MIESIRKFLVEVFNPARAEREWKQEREQQEQKIEMLKRREWRLDAETACLKRELKKVEKKESALREEKERLLDAQES